MKKIIERDVIFPSNIWSETSLSARDLIVKMLNKNYKERITLEEVLTSPWMHIYFP